MVESRLGESTMDDLRQWGHVVVDVDPVHQRGAQLRDRLPFPGLHGQSASLRGSLMTNRRATALSSATSAATRSGITRWAR